MMLFAHGLRPEFKFPNRLFVRDVRGSIFWPKDPTRPDLRVGSTRAHLRFVLIRPHGAYCELRSTISYVCQSRCFTRLRCATVQTWLNGSTFCLGKRLLESQDTLSDGSPDIPHIFDAAFATLLWSLVGSFRSSCLRCFYDMYFIFCTFGIFFVYLYVLLFLKATIRASHEHGASCSESMSLFSHYTVSVFMNK